MAAEGSSSPGLGRSDLAPRHDLDVAWHPSAATSRQPGRPVQPIPGRLLYVWLERPGFRPVDLYLFTTLTDRDAYPLVELVWRYGRRWEVELDLRHIKTTLEIETNMLKKVVVKGGSADLQASHRKPHVSRPLILDRPRTFVYAPGNGHAAAHN